MASSQPLYGRRAAVPAGGRQPSRSPPANGLGSISSMRVAPFAAPSLAASLSAMTTSSAAAAAPLSATEAALIRHQQRRHTQQPSGGHALQSTQATHASTSQLHATSVPSSSARSARSSPYTASSGPTASASSASLGQANPSSRRALASSTASSSSFPSSTASKSFGSKASSSSSTSSSGRPAPSAALIAAALQSQFMSTVKVSKPGSAQAALSQAKKKAAASLAQQLGLIPAPAPKLTQSEWSAVRDRARARGETAEPCPICQEEFKDSEQVLLSCSHVFHKTCLRNFEKFSGTKVCPICRSKEYEKKLIDDAAVDYKHKCATCIQSHWRGYVVRKQYLLMVELIPPKDAEKRQAFFMAKLTKTSTKLAALMENRDTAIDALFADIDKSVMQVRESLSAAAVQLRNFSPDEWSSIRRQACLREETECPICCSGFDAPSNADDEDEGGGGSGGASHTHTKRQVLLSCSHVFHHGCLLSFERFTIASSALDGADDTMLQRQKQIDAFGDEALLQPPPACLCPLCRSNYQKAWF